MSHGPEFVEHDVTDEPGTPADDVIDTVHVRPGWYTRRLAQLQRHPGFRRAATLAGTAAVAVAALLAVVPREQVVDGHGSTVDEAVATPSSSAGAATVRGLAVTAGPLTDYIRQTAAAGSCPTVPVGASPTRAISRQVQAVLPDFTVTDVASTLDEFTGLCSVRLRARAARGVVLALVVSAPSSGTRTRALPYVRTRVGTDPAADGTSTTWVSATTGRGWDIVVGAIGPAGALPSSPTLQRLAQRGGLTW